MHDFEYLTSPSDFKRNIQSVCVCEGTDTCFCLWKDAFPFFFLTIKTKNNYNFSFFASLSVQAQVKVSAGVCWIYLTSD